MHTESFSFEIFIDFTEFLRKKLKPFLILGEISSLHYKLQVNYN